MHSKPKPYSALSDEEIVLLANSGESAAANEIVERMYSLVCFTAAGFANIGMEKADIIQEGMIGLIYAVHTFNPQNSTKFKTYAKSCVTHHLSSVARRQKQKKQIPQEKIISIEHHAVNNTAASPEERIIEHERAAEMMQRMNARLSVFEKQILIQYLSGYSAAEIADTLGINVKRVSNALYRIRQKFHSLIK